MASKIGELASKLFLIANNIEQNSGTASEFSADENQLLINSIRSFATKLNHLSNDKKLSCEDIILGLNLQSHPEGGFYRRFSWTKEQTKTFYLLPAGCVSSWHRFDGIKETWKWLFGGSLLIPQIGEDCQWLGEVELAEGENVTIMEKRNGLDEWGNWFGARHTDGEYSLVMCECSPPFRFSKFQLANEEEVVRFRTLNAAHAEVIDLLSAGNLASHEN